MQKLEKGKIVPMSAAEEQHMARFLNDRGNRERLGKAVGGVVLRLYLTNDEVVTALRRRGLPAIEDV